MSNMLSRFAILAFITIQVTLSSIEANDDAANNAAANPSANATGIKNCAENKSLPICESKGDGPSYLACHSELKFDPVYKIKNHIDEKGEIKESAQDLDDSIKDFASSEYSGNVLAYIECHVDGEYSCNTTTDKFGSVTHTLKCDAPGTAPSSTAIIMIVVVVLLVLICIIVACIWCFPPCSGVKERLCGCCL